LTYNVLGSIKVHWKDAKGNLIKTTEANEGDDLLSIAHEYDIDLEGEIAPLLVTGVVSTMPRDRLFCGS
jgi:hypothetical protein